MAALKLNTAKAKKRRYASSWPTETRAQRRFRSPPRYVSDRRADLIRQPRSPAVSRRQPALPADWRRQADCLPGADTRPSDPTRTSREPRIVRARSIPVYSSSPARICHPLPQNLTCPLHVRFRNGYKDTTVHRFRRGHVCRVSYILCGRAPGSRSAPRSAHRWRCSCTGPPRTASSPASSQRPGGPLR